MSSPSHLHVAHDSTVSKGEDASGLTQRFTELYETHFDFIWRSLRHLGVPEAQIDDAAQDTFVVAHRRLADFEARAAPRTWLFAIAMRVASDHRRSQRRRGRLSQALSDVTPAPSRSPLEDAARSEAQRLCLAALDQLPDEQRGVWVLSELEHMAAPDIAQTLDLKLNTVYSRLRVARTKMLELLGRAVGKTGASR